MSGILRFFKRLVRLVAAGLYWLFIATPFALVGIFLIFAAIGVWWTPNITIHHATPKPVTHIVITRATPAPADTAMTSMTTALSSPQAGFYPETTSQSLIHTRSDLFSYNCNTQPVMLTRSYSFANYVTGAVVNLSIYPAGVGGLAMQSDKSAVTSCGNGWMTYGSTPGTSGFTASMQLPSGNDAQLVEFRRGDAVVTVTTIGLTPPSDLASAVDAALTSSLGNSCKDESAPVSAAYRNPSQPGYTQYSKYVTVSPDNASLQPDMSLLNATPPTVTTPPAGTITEKPVSPKRPVVELSKTVTVPVYDAAGPGCGWAFTGETPPGTPRSLAIQANLLEQQARTAILQDWKNWPSAAASYVAAQANYTADLAAYQETLQILSTTTTTLPPTTTTTTLPPTTTTTTTTPSSTTTTTTTPSSTTTTTRPPH